MYMFCFTFWISREIDPNLTHDPNEMKQPSCGDMQITLMKAFAFSDLITLWTQLKA